MSVFVDNLQATGPYKNPKWRFRSFCHLFADSLEELHLFALKISLNRRWFQNCPKYPHYDLTENKRKKAVLLGAVEKTDFELITYFRKKHMPPYVGG